MMDFARRRGSMLLYEISLYTESKKDFVNPLNDGLKHYTRKDRRCKGPEEKYMDIPVNCNKSPSASAGGACH